MKKHFLFVFCLLVPAAGIVLASTPGSSQAGDFRWEGRLEKGQAVEIKGVHGEVRAEASVGNLVEVIAVKRGSDESANQVRIELVEHNGGVTVCALYPQKTSTQAKCEPGGDWLKAHRNNTKIDFVVRIPEGVRFVTRIANGNITASNLSGSVEAYTVNGDVRVSTAEQVRAETVNGNITASMGSSVWNDTLAFTTINGSITLELPPTANADLQVDTINGQISAELPLTVRGEFKSNKLEGMIGNGGGKLKLSTINGNVKLKRK
jgi:DUF4097 and DUF4098 domain-containing protein YvlB